MIKMYCIFAKESIDAMKGNRGKLASMAGHAYLHSYWKAMHHELFYVRDIADRYYMSPRAYKITLIVPTADDLRVLENKYRKKGVCGVSMVVDAGLTVFDGPTTCALGIGPIHVDDIEDDLKNLKVFI